MYIICSIYDFHIFTDVSLIMPKKLASCMIYHHQLPQFPDWIVSKLKAFSFCSLIHNLLVSHSLMFHYLQHHNTHSHKSDKLTAKIT